MYVEHPFTRALKNDSTPIVKVKNYKAAFDPYLTSSNNIASISSLLLRRGFLRSRFSMSGKCSTPIATFKEGEKDEIRY